MLLADNTLVAHFPSEVTLDKMQSQGFFPTTKII